MTERTRIDRLIEDVLACAPEERDAFLDAACEGNAALRSEIASLLEQASRANSFLEQPAAVPSLVGRTLGPYRIDAPIGAGGMGEVYRARDTKLGRDVAIKILPAFMAQDPDRLARLGREARTLAALNHPHIGSIYGIEEADGVRGLVLELVDGETLADRIAKGPLAIGEAVRIAGQIAEALAAAHAKGIVHRDLKPANIKITTSGSVKVLDFGLAKADGDESGGTTIATREGTVMGTPAYMSPEQARGEAVDQQTDIWAFGCVLYEMLTARRAFGGPTASDCIAAVLKAEPDWLPVPAATPAAVRTLLTRCLAKDRARRLHSIADAHFDLGDALTRATPERESTRWPAWQKWSLAAAAGLAIGVAFYLFGQASAVAPSPVTQNVELDLLDGFKPFAGVAISPDGKAVAASVALDAGGIGKHLTVRYFDQLSGWQRINGGKEAEYPFWSPDGKQLAFFADGKLLRVAPPNGVPIVVCEVVEGRSGVWLEDGTIVFGSLERPLLRVDPYGGHAAAVLVPAEEGVTFVYPVTAGAGRLLYLAQHEGGQSELRAITLDAPERATTVVKTARSGVYDRGYLFYDRDGYIVGQRFDPSTNRFQGEPVRVTRGVEQPSGRLGYLPMAAAGGHVVVATIPESAMQLAWRTRRGDPAGDLGDAFDQQNPDLSPDGKWLAIERRMPDQPNTNIWIVDTLSGNSRKLTSGFLDYAPLWAKDGERVAYTSMTGLSNKLIEVNVEGPPTPTPIEERLSRVRPLGWTTDGRLAWSASGAKKDLDPKGLGIFVRPEATGSRQPPTAFRTGFPASAGRVSPDGRHIAYTAARSGKPEVYVDTFPTPALRPEQISVAGGREPHWRGDGKELYFIAGDDLLVKTWAATGPSVVPTVLFKLATVSAPNRNYAVNADGSKFLVLVPKTKPPQALKLSLNWFSSQAARD